MTCTAVAGDAPAPGAVAGRTRGGSARSVQVVRVVRGEYYTWDCTERG